MKVKFLGNQHSFHLLTWKNIYKLLNISINEIGTIHSPLNKFEREFSVNLSFLPKIFCYMVLGLYYFFNLKDSKTLFHAHGASGYGLSALISRKKYIITIYGSEVLNPNNSWLYRLVVKLVLRDAQAITVTSDYVRDFIHINFNISLSKIHCFHTGVDVNKLKNINISLQDIRKEEISILSVRNSAAHYRIREIVYAFNNVKNKSAKKISLTLIQGNGDNNYWNSLKKEFGNGDDIYFIDGSIDNKEMLRLINFSDICVSFPVTDQLSSTILEVLYYNKTLVSSDLEAYSVLKKERREGVYFATTVGDLEDYLSKLIEEDIICNYQSLILERFSLQAAAVELNKLLESLKYE